MRRSVVLISVLVVAAGHGRAAKSIRDVQAFRKERQAEKGLVEAIYKFGDQYVSVVEQARRRGAEAAEAWKQRDKLAGPLVVLGRSPFGGGETSKSYWPEGVEPELLRKIVPLLAKKGVEVVLPDLPEEPGESADGDDDDGDEGDDPPKPFPGAGFSKDHEFVLVVGFHHEPVPYKSGARPGSGEGPAIRSSRISAWAILFHAETGSAFWAATAATRASHRIHEKPVSFGAQAALAGLDFADFGKGNVSQHIARYAARKELPALDVAAMLVQTQRADAVAAVISSSIGKGAFTSTAWVLRWFNERGTVQDYRIDAEQAQRSGCVRVSQRVMMRILFLEQLRGMRGIQPCVYTASMPQEEDIEVQPMGAAYATRLGPISPDDEVVLLGELANRSVTDRNGAFWRNPVAAVRAVGRCRTYIEEAIIVAKVYANRPTPRPRRGRKPRPDRLKEAGQAAVAELIQAKAEQIKERALRAKNR